MNVRLLLLPLSLIISLFSGNIFAQKKFKYVIDMVHNNPGEPSTQTAFNNPNFLQQNGFTGQVVNHFKFIHASITFISFDSTIFPQGSKELQWVINNQNVIKKEIADAKKAGIEVYYFTDIIVLPKRLVEKYHEQICDANGKISFEKPLTVEIHKKMLEEVLQTFPDLDGLVIRTGETYLNDVPYHTGNNPITNGVQSHVKLISLLREIVCEKYHKKIFYRTWGFGGMHDDPAYYLDVVNQIQPHQNLIFSIKHTRGDYHRTYDFNPTLTLGKHQQIIEVQCQREYEGKGAYPNYIANGLINGFEEYESYKPQKGYKSLDEIKNNPNIVGVWTWSRGGGWVGPYITNEFWCKLNALVISSWANNIKTTEADAFNTYITANGITGKNKTFFRELCLLSAKGIIRGHATIKLPFDSNLVWWTRDEFLSGIDSISDNGSRFSSEGFLYSYFKKLYTLNLLETAVKEKEEAEAIWEKIYTLAQQITIPDKEDNNYLKVSSQYGLLLHKIIAESWKIMAYGFEGDQTGQYNYTAIANAIKKYDTYWKEFEKLKEENKQCATLYKPYSFVYEAPGYHMQKGIGNTVNKYRKIVNNQKLHTTTPATAISTKR